eukprot:scaffold8306_cov171-Amphora_coffeaeformis.AAC.4
MNQPCLFSKGKTRPVSHVLVLVPANTVQNWENEVQKWTAVLDKPLRTSSLCKISKDFRQIELERWQREGGVLFLTGSLFLGYCSFLVNQAQPDMVFINEAHTLPKHSQNKTAKELRNLDTKRRVLLTGTPLQNNPTEYFQLIDFVRPGAIADAKTEQDFEQAYRKPIEDGLAADAEKYLKDSSKNKQLHLHKICEDFVHRVDAEHLRAGLPAFSDTLLYLQTSGIQDSILRKYRTSCKEGLIDGKSFFKKYHAISPVLNHPGCMNFSHNQAWMWDEDQEKMKEAWKSPKFIILVHILAMADQLGEKTLVYSKCLETLNMIEHFLKSPDWKKQIASLKDTFDGASGLENWKKNRDYLRIDGNTDPGKRGHLVDTFNNHERVRVFLISSIAGGIGINLTSATRVVIMDNHFNPSVSTQCVARAHRYGQTKPVHCYRLAIEGTLEAKVYARAVNKSSVASGVVDGEYLSQEYTKADLENLTKIDCWATCSECQKKRLLPPGKFEGTTTNSVIVPTLTDLVRFRPRGSRTSKRR